MGVLALVGTAKGLFVLRGNDERRHWRAEGPLLGGWGVYHATVDARDGTLYAATNHRVYGSTVQRSEDGGGTWRRSQKIGLPEESGLTVEAVWHVAPGRPEEPETLYLGAAPGVLFRSDDRGETWEVNRALLEHPTRDGWFPGAGGLCCHSVQLDPRDPQCIYVAITAAGVWADDEFERVPRRAAANGVPALLALLSDRERLVVSRRFGLDGQACTLRDIAADLGLSAERVRQIEERALERLRTACLATGQLEFASSS